MYCHLDTVDTCKVSGFESTLYDPFFSLGMNSGDFTGDWYDIHYLKLVLLYITYPVNCLVKKKYL